MAGTFKNYISLEFIKHVLKTNVCWELLVNQREKQPPISKSVDTTVKLSNVTSDFGASIFICICAVAQIQKTIALGLKISDLRRQATILEAALMRLLHKREFLGRAERRQLASALAYPEGVGWRAIVL
nr:hypothetical protein [Tateyamaria sp. syn59]